MFAASTLVSTLIGHYFRLEKYRDDSRCGRHKCPRHENYMKLGGFACQSSEPRFRISSQPSPIPPDKTHPSATSPNPAPRPDPPDTSPSKAPSSSYHARGTTPQSPHASLSTGHKAQSGWQTHASRPSASATPRRLPKPHPRAPGTLPPTRNPSLPTPDKRHKASTSPSPRSSQCNPPPNESPAQTPAQSPSGCTVSFSPAAAAPAILEVQSQTSPN